jgi:hypothetical protein
MEHYGHMILTFRKTLTSALLVMTAIVPFQVSAATTPTPQMALDAALAKFMTQTSMRAETEMSMNMQKRTLKTRVYSPASMVKLRLSQRTAPTINGFRDSEGKLVIEGFEVEGATTKLTSPLTIEWKKVGTSIYFRLSTLPPEIAEILAQLEVDPTPILGKWLQVDLKDSAASLEESLAKEIPGADFSSLIGVSSLPSLKQALRVIRVESTTKSADGHSHLRLRVRLNPTLVTQLQQREIAAIPKGTSRAAMVKEVNARYAKLRSVLTSLQMVAVVDRDAQKLERVELGMERVEPTQDCEWNDAWTKQICKTVGYQKTKLSLGMSFFADSVTSIVAPTAALPFEEALKSIAPPERQPEPEPAEWMEDVTTSTVAI